MHAKMSECNFFVAVKVKGNVNVILVYSCFEKQQLNIINVVRCQGCLSIENKFQ